MKSLRMYIMTAGILVMFITAAYLEFPVVTTLILVICLVLYFCSQDWNNRGKTLDINRRSNSSNYRAALTPSSRPRGKASKGKSENRAQLLTGLSGFCITVEGPFNLRFPLAKRRVADLVKAVLIDEELLCFEQDKWLQDSDYSQLQVLLLIEKSGPEIRLTVHLEVAGRVEIIRSAANIVENVALWKRTITRITVASDLSSELEEAISSGLNALLRDYYGSTYGAGRKLKGAQGGDKRLPHHQ